MRVIGLCGASGAGKTTLAEALIAGWRQAGHPVSVIKHAHKHFDIDRPGKDSHRHRSAGAYEVLVANDRRLALMREHEDEQDLGVHALIAQLTDRGTPERPHWVLVEGFKHGDLPKIEVWRAARPADVCYPVDALVVAVATTDDLPQPTRLPVLDLDRPDTVLQFLQQDAARYDYRPR